MPPPLCTFGKGFEHRNGERRPFFWPSPNFGPKTGLNLSDDHFFFGLHLILCIKTDLVLGWKIFILIFIILKFSEFPGPPPFENPVYATDYTFKFSKQFEKKIT